MMNEETYMCGCQNRWRKKVLSGCLFVSIVMLAMNCALVLSFKRKEATLVAGRAFEAMFHAGWMSLADFAATFIAYCIERTKVNIRVKNYVAVFTLVLILSLGSLLHEYVYISLLFPCLAILIVQPFVDMVLLNITSALTLLISVVSCLLWAFSASPSPLVMCAVIVGVAGSCCVFYFFSCSMFNAMMSQTKIVIEGLEEQERLVAELKLEPLTRLYNRAAFQEAIYAAMSDFRHFGHNASLAFIDLDNFKSVNDKFGHASGDAVLISFAELLTGEFGTNRNVFRYGGDEFAVLFKGTAIEDVKDTMEKIREHYANMTFDFITGNIQVSASIGIASYREGMTGKEWIKAADDAAYAAKNAGKNNVVVSNL